MNYILVDDERIILEGMEYTLRKVVEEDAKIFKAQDPYEAIEIIKKNQIDIALCDVDMPGMNGLELAGIIQEISEDTDIIFVTGYAHYSLEAWKTTAVAFVLKPVGEEEVSRALLKITKRRIKKIEEKQGTSMVSAETKKDIEVMCFGNFEILYHGRPIHFARKKSKEMLAYLVDRRGTMISTDELRAILWEEEADTEEKKGYIRVLANDIRKSLEVLEVGELLLNDQNSYSIDVSKVSCDYLDFLNGDEKSQRKFQQEYMVQYSWAESTLGRLINMKN